MVDPELDGGPTLFQQKVHVEPYDEEEALRVGKKIYETTREETTRQRIIRAEAIYAPLVMAMVGSDAPRKIVTNLEAFTVEGRPEFIEDPAYQAQLHEEYHEWLEADESRSDVSYEDWHANHRVPYGRVLFEINDEWQTLEQLFNAEEFAERENIDPNREYVFYISHDRFGGHQEAMRIACELITAAQGNPGDRGRLIRSQVIDIGHIDHGDCYRCTVECVTDISAELEKRDIPFEIIEHPVRATAKRKPSPGGSLTTEDIA